MPESASGKLSSPRGVCLLWCAAGALFALLAVVVTWPLAGQLSTGLPLGTEQVATVPLLNLWTLAWNVESLTRGYEGYWQAPIFHPASHAFAYSEPQPVTGWFAAPLSWMSGSVLTAYNLVLIGALALNGWLLAVLLRCAGLGLISSLAGGAWGVVLPFTHQELGVLQLVPLAGVLCLAIGVGGFAADPSLRQGLLLGFAGALAYGLCSQTTVFAGLVLAPAAVWLWRAHLGQRQAWIHLATGGLLGLLLLSPVLAAQVRATSGERFERSMETVRKRSARPAHYLESPWPELVSLPGVEVAERPSRRAFWPGALKIGLAAVAVVWGLRRRRLRSLTLAALLVTASGFVLSLGPNLHLGGVSLIDGLRQIPGLSQIRSFFRFALFVQLGVVVLAAIGLELVQRLVLQRWRRAAGGRAAGAITLVLAIVVALEMRPAMGPIQPLPPADLDLPWLAWIVESSEPDDVFAFVPFPEGRTSREYLGTAQWMYWQMQHWRPMANGYSGFFPQHFQRLKKSMGEFPSASSLRSLHEAGVRYCVVHRAFLADPPRVDPRADLWLRAVFSDDRHALDIYALEPRTQAVSAQVEQTP